MKKKLAIAALVAGLAIPTIVLASDGPQKFPIFHDGEWIEVSCNAASGHLQHADLIELITIYLSGFINCR